MKIEVCHWHNWNIQFLLPYGILAGSVKPMWLQIIAKLLVVSKLNIFESIVTLYCGFVLKLNILFFYQICKIFVEKLKKKNYRKAHGQFQCYTYIFDFIILWSTFCQLPHYFAVQSNFTLVHRSIYLSTFFFYKSLVIHNIYITYIPSCNSPTHWMLSTSVIQRNYLCLKPQNHILFDTNVFKISIHRNLL